MKFVLRLLLRTAIGLSPFSVLNAHIFRMFGANIGAGVRIEKTLLVSYDGSNLNNLTVKDGSFIGAGAIIDIKEKITIEERVRIAPGCNIMTHADCGTGNPLLKIYPAKYASVTVGQNCWIGVGVTILCGVTIGENSVIGASSLVTKDIPPKSLAVGSPAKVIKKLDL